MFARIFKSNRYLNKIYFIMSLRCLVEAIVHQFCMKVLNLLIYFRQLIMVC